MGDSVSSNKKHLIIVIVIKHHFKFTKSETKVLPLFPGTLGLFDDDVHEVELAL